MDPETLKKEIEKLDSELIQLLNKRIVFSLKTKTLDKEFGDREKELENLVEKSDLGNLREAYMKNVLKSIIKETKTLKASKIPLVGFQGEHGGYGEVAAKKFDNSAVTVQHAEFTEVFEGVSNGQLDYGIIPVEHFLSGATDQIGHLLYKHDLKVVVEIQVPVHYSLLTLPSTDYRDIKVVYSHQQALAQCREFLKRNRLEPRPYYDTAGAAMMLTRNRQAATAVAASELCAKLYNLKVIKTNIEDNKQNLSRFFVLSKKNIEEGDKCSIIFSMQHKAGTLPGVLDMFSESNINIRRINSMAIVGKLNQYAFFLDFDGSDKDENVRKVLKKVEKKTTMFKFLGCYKEDF